MKKGKWVREILSLKLDGLLRKLPDKFTGETRIMKSKYRELYGDKECGTMIHIAKIQTLKWYVVISLILIIALTLLPIYHFLEEDLILKDKKAASYIERPQVPLQGKVAVVTVKANYKDIEVNEQIHINVNPGKLSPQEERKIIKGYGMQLETIIAGENKSLRQVKTNLNLPEQDLETGIIMEWYSDKEKIMDETGKLDLIYAATHGKKEGLNLQLRCRLSLGNTSLEKIFPIKIKLPKEGGAYENSVRYSLKQLEKQLSHSQGAEILSLPQNIGGDIQLQWQEKNPFPIGIMIILCFLSILYIYKNRYKKLEKEMKDVRESMSRDFPELINKMVLLLNAGLVVTSVIGKIAEGYELHKKDCQSTQERSPLYEEICLIERRVRETNAPMGAELKDFARRSGVKEILRFSAILDENMNKGTLLVEKLQLEGDMLWLNRKKRAEEKGRLAETKLTFPLVLLLFTLMVITVAPTFLEM